MGIDPPKATSTPTGCYPVRGRKGIRENNSVQSPIDAPDELHKYEFYTRSRSKELSPNRSPSRSPRVSPMVNRSPRHQREERLPPSGSETSKSDSYEPSEEPAKISPNRRVKPVADVCDSQSSTESGSTKLKYAKWCLGIAAIAIAIRPCIGYIGAHILNKYNNNDNNNVSKNTELTEVFAKVEKEFVKQEEDFWRNIRVCIQEVSELHKPRSIIFVYDSKAKESMEKILKKVSRAALCYFKDCSYQPVEIQGSELNTSDIINDYGKIISQYRDPLEKNGVLILEHLEQVPGKSAQAFHHFCDEYNPVVQKALLLFTLEVDKVPDSYAVPFVEKFLLNLWKDVGVDDKFHPLFTRISGTVLRVQTE